jgi:hypothetical protein
LRFVDADDLADQAIEFDGLKVRNAQMETLGAVEGFIVDAQTARPYYVVVDSGGWFKSKHFLVPIGHARIDGDNDALVVDLSKERINRFPGFDKDEFQKMGEDDLKRFNDDTCIAIGAPAGRAVPATDSFTAQWDRAEYALPTWWSAQASRPDRMGEGAFTAGVEYPPSKVAPTSGDVSRPQTSRATKASDTDRPTTVHEKEDSPFFDGRAQPGDVLGLDTGGERTYVGDTADDENERRRDAEKAAKK